MSRTKKKKNGNGGEVVKSSKPKKIPRQELKTKAARRPGGLWLYGSRDIKEQTKLVFESAAVTKLVSVKENCFRLQTLLAYGLQSCWPDSAAELFCSIIKQNPGLKTFHIYGGNVAILKCVLECCSAIEDILFCMDITLDEVRNILVQYPQLKRLCFRLSITYYSKVIEYERTEHGVDISLFGYQDVDKFLSGFDNLRKVRLQRTKATDNTLRTIMSCSAAHLQILSVNELPNISHEVLKEVLRTCPNLIHLEFCSLNSSTVAEVFEVPNVLKMVKLFTYENDEDEYDHNDADSVSKLSIPLSSVMQIIKLCPHGNRFRFAYVSGKEQIPDFKKLLNGYRDEGRAVECELLFGAYGDPSLSYSNGEFLGTQLDEYLEEEERGEENGCMIQREKDWISGDRKVYAAYESQEESEEEKQEERFQFTDK